METGMKVATTIPAGAIFTITTGAYSDYSISGVFKAIKDIDPDALVAQWLAKAPEQAEPYGFNETQFLAWLTREGILTSVPSFEWHLYDFHDTSGMTLHEMEI
jgi:hypothetical protein